MAKKKYSGKEPMGVKKAAEKTAKRAKTESLSKLGKFRSGNQGVSSSTARITRKNTQGGKLSLKDKVTLSDFYTMGKVGRPAFKSDEEYMGARIVQSRRSGETSRTASRAKGIAKRQAKVAKARRAKKALGN